MSEPTLSIIAAAVNGSHTLDGWLRAVAPQIEGRDIQVLVVGPDDDPAIQAAVNICAFVEHVNVERGVLVPSMWSAGLRRARGSIVAFTITPCVPERDWVDAILAAHQAPYAAIGGVIDRGGGLVDRAVHLVRYTAYLPPLDAGPVAEVAGDNGTYKLADLTPFLSTITRDGFWEADINRQLRARGATLWIDPRIRVRHQGSYSLGGFARQRFVHGRVFGASRRSAYSPSRQVVQAALAPIVPVVMIVRIVRTVAGRGRLDARTLAAVPLAYWFLWCWAVGEAVGLLGG